MAEALIQRPRARVEAVRNHDNAALLCLNQFVQLRCFLGHHSRLLLLWHRSVARPLPLPPPCHNLSLCMAGDASPQILLLYPLFPASIHCHLRPGHRGRQRSAICDDITSRCSAGRVLCALCPPLSLPHLSQTHGVGRSDTTRSSACVGVH